MEIFLYLYVFLKCFKTSVLFETLLQHFWSIIFAILKRFWHRSSNMSPRSRVRDLVISSFLNRPSIRMCCFVELSSRAKDRLGFSSNCNRFVCRNIFMLNVRRFEFLFRYVIFLEKTISEVQRNFFICSKVNSDMYFLSLIIESCFFTRKKNYIKIENFEFKNFTIFFNPCPRFLSIFLYFIKHIFYLNFKTVYTNAFIMNTV